MRGEDLESAETIGCDAVGGWVGRLRDRRVLSTKLKLTPAGPTALDAVLERCEIIPQGADPSPISIRDPDDELVLAGAIAGGSQILVSGDADLLLVAEQSPIRILSPRAFMTLTRAL